ncbi:hypothetical protein BABINDRAFT_33431 [Babjeviella inositovora NRRL Y-12698]|uniref:SGNH hydrolase-type esterase domain-containing protein n=1 Tax=Babjeviella inositovora NRRL Y-12698 TaxID=984486 RepID=A0A1E3QWR5_9ASCO|nr:uncharacterized protein BABINDRAFT_33431 [Babjeviella inositovora NRRL Y-12698]ODQ81944.1 hypothetical protein BABINDRAFT_33431 [Babjeviella inositovora NRRL Y-12698]
MTRPLLDFNKVIIFGDSITQFAYNSFPTFDTNDVHFAYGSGMTNAYTRKMDVVQRGYGGYNSEHARALIDHILPDAPESEYTRPVLITVFFGTNDAAVSGPQHVDIDRYLENMAYIVDRATSKGIKVVLIGPGWHNQDRWYAIRPDGKAEGIYRTTEVNKQYSEALGALAKEKNVGFADLWQEFDAYEKANGEGSFSDLLTDGIHFTGKGYLLMFDEVMKVIRETYPELYPDNIPLRLPDWKDVCMEDFK